MGHRAITQNQSLQKSVKRANLSRGSNIRTCPCWLSGHPPRCWTRVLGIWDSKTVEPIRFVHGLKTCGHACHELMSFFSHASRALSDFKRHCGVPCFLEKAGHSGQSLSRYFPTYIMEFLNTICIQVPSL